MTRIHVDIETYSEADLKKEGLYRYAQDPSTDLNVFCWAIGDGPVNVWMPWDKIPKEVFRAIRSEMDKGSKSFTGAAMPADVEQILLGIIAAHNAQFERVVLNNWLARKSISIVITIANTICTMAKCDIHDLPQAL